MSNVTNELYYLNSNTTKKTYYKKKRYFSILDYFFLIFAHIIIYTIVHYECINFFFNQHVNFLEAKAKTKKKKKKPIPLTVRLS